MSSNPERERFANALADESSPYLLQHSDNPVEWYPWGESAFEKARRERKPVFLSVGYATCYWCHVMERHDFEDPEIAAQMNRDFVNVKVDREERPDVDGIYMTAVQAMTGHGGWPMSVFLTPPGAKGADDPGLKPFFAGTYFPPRPRHGMPSFPDILERVARAWREDRERVIEQADRVADAIARHQLADTAGEPDAELVQIVVDGILQRYDPEHGGFGSAPKFPQPVNLRLLMRAAAENPEAGVEEAIHTTLERMARGGMYDQIGGGFHRYSTDERWLVPHFEKMLYDNGELLVTYARAQAWRPHPADPELYRRVLRATADYLIREMTDDTGALWSAEDAEVDGREGESYLWTRRSLRAAIDDPALADLAERLYGLDGGTNFRDPHDADAEPANVLYMPRPVHELAAERGESLEALLENKARIDAALFAARERRKQPRKDDKVLAAWNGLAVAGLAEAGAVLGDDALVERAAGAASAVLRAMRDGTGGLRRAMRGGEAHIDGFLEDYAGLARGLLALEAQRPGAGWLEPARELMETAAARFRLGEAGYVDAPDGELFAPLRSFFDAAYPSAHAMMAHNWLDLAAHTGEAGYEQRAWGDLRAAAGALREQPMAMPHMAHALWRALRESGRATPAEPRPREPVTVTPEPDRVAVGPEGAELTLRLRVDPEYHLTSLDGRGAPLELEIEGDDGLTVEADLPDPAERALPFADEPVPVYEGEIALAVRLRRRGPAEGGTPRLWLRYRPCTNRACLETKRREVPVAIEAASG